MLSLDCIMGNFPNIKRCIRVTIPNPIAIFILGKTMPQNLEISSPWLWVLDPQKILGHIIHPPTYLIN